MRSRPRDSFSPDRDQLSTDQIEIALSFLKKRFTDYTLDEIILSLSQRIQTQFSEGCLDNRRTERPTQAYPRQRDDFRQDEGGLMNARRTRFTHNNRDQRELRENIGSISANNEQKLNRFEQVRLVAKFFCQTGLNYSLVRYFFPDMSPQQYRAYIDTINNQAINEIQKFLRYECNIQIEHLSADQKRSLKTQLMKVRDWLGIKSVSQLETYYKFIQRHYEQKPVQISYDEALKLYKILLQIIKSPYVDIMDVIDPQEREAQRTPVRGSQRQGTSLSNLTREEQVRIVQSYLKFKRLSRMSEFLNEKWGFSMKWSKHSITTTLKRCLRRTIKKVILSKDKYLPRGTQIMFGDSEPEVITLYESEEAEPVREKLFKFYLANRITATGLMNVIKDLNIFFTRQQASGDIQLVSSQQEVSAFPKVEADISKRQPEQNILTPPAPRLIPEVQQKEQPQQERDKDQLREEKLTQATNEDVKQEIESRAIQEQDVERIIQIE